MLYDARLSLSCFVLVAPFSSGTAGTSTTMQVDRPECARFTSGSSPMLWRFVASLWRGYDNAAVNDRQS